MLLKDPQSGPVMEGTGGIRKVRFPLSGVGKRGSVRVCYTDFEEYELRIVAIGFLDYYRELIALRKIIIEVSKERIVVARQVKKDLGVVKIKFPWC